MERNEITKTQSRKFSLICKELEALALIAKIRLSNDSNHMTEEDLDELNCQGLKAVNEIFRSEVTLVKRKEDNKTYFTFYADKVKVFEWGISEEEDENKE